MGDRQRRVGYLSKFLIYFKSNVIKLDVTVAFSYDKHTLTVEIYMPSYVEH